MTAGTVLLLTLLVELALAFVAWSKPEASR